MSIICLVREVFNTVSVENGQGWTNEGKPAWTGGVLAYLAHDKVLIFRCVDA